MGGDSKWALPSSCRRQQIFPPGKAQNEVSAPLGATCHGKGDTVLRKIRQAGMDPSFTHRISMSLLIRKWNSIVKLYKISHLRSSPGINHHKSKIFPNTTQLHHPRAWTQTTSTDFCLTCSPNSHPTGFPKRLSFISPPLWKFKRLTYYLALGSSFYYYPCLVPSCLSHGENSIVVPFKATFPILDDSFPFVFLG